MSEDIEPNQSSLGSAIGTLLVNMFGPWTAKVGHRWGAPSEQKNITAVIEEVQKIEAKESIIIDADFEPSDTAKLALIDGAAGEEHTDVQKMWARLIIASKSNPASSEYKPFVEALKQFTPTMAVVLEAIAHQLFVYNGTEDPTIGLQRQYLASASQLAEYHNASIVKALALLERCGVIQKIEQEFHFFLSTKTGNSRMTLENDIVSLSRAIKNLSTMSSIPFSECIDRSTIEGKEVAVLSVKLTDFGMQLGHILYPDLPA